MVCFVKKGKEDRGGERISQIYKVRYNVLNSSCKILLF